MIDLTNLLKSLGLGALRQTRSAWPTSQPAGVLVNDIHSQLNPTRVDKVVSADSPGVVQRTLDGARKEGKSISITGGRHAMGGQQFGAGTILLDARPLNKMLSFDLDAGLLEVEAGIEWPQLIQHYLREQEDRSPHWGIAQKQTGADRLSIGGALAANVHGRGLSLRPIVGDIDSFVLVDAEGNMRTCSRTENKELFRLAIGGYGLFGIIYSVKLRLVRRQKLERVVEVIQLEDLMARVEQRLADGFLYGDFQFSIDEKSEDFLHQGIFPCYRPVDPATPMPADPKTLSEEDWARLLYLAHTDRAEAFWQYTDYYLSTSGQVYWSDTHQLSAYLDNYHRSLDRRLGKGGRATEVITEIYVPRHKLTDFMGEVQDDFRKNQVQVIYGTIRLIEKDEESFLAWAKQRYACVIFNLHTIHTDAGIRHSAEAFRRLIDMAIRRDGSYFLTYHKYATREQVERCYPQFSAFLRWKRTYDPDERFQSDWYRHYRDMFADGL